MPTPLAWPAPSAPAPIEATVRVPGSKSETNRALVLAALSSGSSTITGGLEARDTALMRAALRSLGVQIAEEGSQWRVDPPAGFTAGTTINCGLAGTVMRFVPPVAALADGPVTFDADEQAYARPMDVILEALATLGASIEADALALPFTINGHPLLPGGVVTVDASDSSQFVSALLLAGARYVHGVDVRHQGGAIPSQPHIDMTVAMLRDRGVTVDDSKRNRWVVSPGAIAPLDVSIEPDLSNAAPFLAAAAITGGSVTVPHWPARTHQPGEQLCAIFRRFGAEVVLHDGGLTVHGRDELHPVDLDLHDASELTPVVAAMAALADGTSHIRGVAHIRGHETNRLAALEANLNALGAHVSQTADGLTIHPRLLGGSLWRTYADHRMAQAGALLGLVVTDIELDDIGCTSKTMPEFADLWAAMISDSEQFSDARTGQSDAVRREAPQ
ncbi:MAG TPA: 3-phosphoshikimate 1-carboxyvinyltransferase [Propionibacteriaceae bacterium]|nr:3-phosphoshikimate 1-carboxyvinyltransferase [Propionibacteriaceae bacterium]